MSARARLVSPAGDDGTSLVELIIAMMVMSVFLLMLGAGVQTLVGVLTAQRGTMTAQDATGSAFLLLDKQIRYADRVTGPGTVGGDQWVEWRVPDPRLPVTATTSAYRCYQWRASPAAGTLSYRSWVVPAGGAPVPAPDWVRVADHLTITQPVFTTGTGLAAAPFALPVLSGTYGTSRAQVGVLLDLRTTAPDAHSTFSTVFTALNSSATPATDCSEVARA